MITEFFLPISPYSLHLRALHSFHPNLNSEPEFKFCFCLGRLLDQSNLTYLCVTTVVLEKTLDSPLDCKEIQPVHPKGNHPWIFIGRTDAEAETPILWLPDVKNWSLGKDPDAGKDWRQEEKGMTEHEMLGWHQRLNGHEFEQAPGVGDGQGGRRAAVHGVAKSWLSNWTDWLTDLCVRCYSCKLSYTALWSVHEVMWWSAQCKMGSFYMPWCGLANITHKDCTIPWLPWFSCMYSKKVVFPGVCQF